MKNIKKKYNIITDNRFTLLEIIVITLAFSVLTSVITGFVVYKINDNNLILDNSLTDIINTYNQIKSEYYGKIDMQEISDKAIKTMMLELDEKYSVYMDDEETNRLDDKLSGTYYGIGIAVKVGKDNLEITNVYEDTPASIVGLKKGDIITSIDGVVVESSDDAINKITELINDKDAIKIGILRDNERLSFDLKITRIEKQVVNSKIYKKNNKLIGLVNISTFSSNSSKQFREEIKRLESKNIDSLIIDVRSNTGGYLTSANEIISMFTKKNSILYTLEDKKGKKNVYDETSESKSYDVVILINQITASASEILASSLKNNYGAILVGAKTYGKGKVQETKRLSDNTMIKYTSAMWYTPDGESIDGIGIMPDIEVSLGINYLKNPTEENDSQLQKAIELLSK